MSNQHLKEGNLVLDCIASDPTSSTASLYGIATATPSDPSNEYTVLVKSNPNPSDVKALQWTVVSMVKLSETAYRYPVPGTVACAVSSEEEFTAFFYDTTTRSMSGINSVAGPAVVSVGVRYNPKSGWKDIRGPSRFFGDKGDVDEGLQMKYQQLAFYVPRAGGGEEVVMLLTDEYTSVVRFGVVDETTNTLQLAGVWKLKQDGTYEKGALSDTFKRTTFILQPGVFPLMSNANSRQVAYGDGHLYFTGERGWEFDNHTSTLTTYPFENRDNARNEVNGTKSRAGTQMIQDPSNTHNSKMALQSLPMGEEHFYSQEHFPLSRFESIGQSTPFAVISMTDGLYSIPLTVSDASASRNMTGPVDVLIMASESVHTWPRVYARQRENRSSPIFENEATLVGVILAGLAVVALGVVLFLLRRSRQQKEKEKEREGSFSDIELKDVRGDV
ncbi:hypothetical protein BGZ96_009718 [Linnemannia gamsii]|uniref:Uncharacterized protein n=1 Tax=Linnemannia gamsii TaxID=64522 RepID=A0ABQ7KD27_9FUNG|nr:hypothetical protein BGZ96_009718 [Linnemannia gamsii]